MKKIAILFIFSVFTVSAFAQKFGVRAGLNFANVSVSGLSVSGKTGINAGIFLNFKVASVVSIQPELAYAGYGYTYSTTGVSGEATTKYLSLPVLLRVKIPLTGLAFYAGPQYSILLKADNTVAGVTSDAKDSYKSGDFSAVGGIEFSLPVGLFATVRYQAGLSNISSSSATVDVKNNAISLLVGFKF